MDTSERKTKAGLGDPHIPCTCLSELEDDAYELGGPSSRQKRPPPCKASTHRRLGKPHGH